METYLRVGTGIGRHEPMDPPPQGLFEPEPPPLSRELLAAYLDLRSGGGPLHAQCVADAGRHLVAGTPIPAYQTVPLQMLREALRAECPTCPNPASPEQLTKELRSAPWQHLCALLGRWPALPRAEQSRVVVVLAKLGFWQTIAERVPLDTSGDDLDSLRLLYLRHVAEGRVSATPEAAAGPAYAGALRATEAIAYDEDTDPVSRHGAAAHTIVLYAKLNRKADMRRAARLVEDLDRDDRLSPLNRSIAWRAVAFVPFFDGDHAEVARQLQLAETYATEALTGSVDRLAARENMIPLLETSGRSAKARDDKPAAERYYRRMAEWDPLDPKGHLRLADFLKGERRTKEALAAYRTAAHLGAPYASYAFQQVARCLIETGQPVRSHGPLVAAAILDPRALPPLMTLRAVSDGGLQQWAEGELVRRMGGSRHREASSWSEAV